MITYQHLLIRNRNSRRDLSVADCSQFIKLMFVFHELRLRFCYFISCFIVRSWQVVPPPIARVAWLVEGTSCPCYDLPCICLAMVHWLFDTFSATNIILKVHRLPANRHFVFNYRKLVDINGAIIRMTTFTFYHKDIYHIYICVSNVLYIYIIYISALVLKNFHHNHKTIVKQSYSYKGNLYSGKSAYLYWNYPQVVRDTFMTNTTDVAAIIFFVV